ncbi:hypothetical protein ACQEU5_06060 [Marinactinospora thermotolerans]|uniref:Small secreted domain n=1 Tax=Marinactinospora thermotolerans DSM 45154 TaxID=1122192 RepID=A0A1T4ST98_9ACTN|nr:hypothetical protein [Marinactinospora thermotolerans]SKA31520.1 hypothetical protein SAMN02745673_03974 [Marinactinospora thermotolerans DSM 45154]
MFKKFSVVGLIAGAALGSVLMAAPAHAEDDNDNAQVAAVQQCNSSINVIGIPINALSNQEIGQCVNGPQQTVND